jgi:glucosyl-3-phosphoglycerate phosphatase
MSADDLTKTHPAPGVEGWAAMCSAARSEPCELSLDRFLFLRHGETARNVSRVYQTADEPLNDIGEKQALAAAAVLAGQNVGALVASTMARAWRTANLVGEACRLAPHPEPDLRERLFTSLWGTPVGTLDWACDPDGCETLAEFVGRVRRGARSAHTRHAGNGKGELLLVAHGGVLLALCAWLGVQGEEPMRRNAQPIRFERKGGVWRASLVGEAVAGSAMFN